MTNDLARLRTDLNTLAQASGSGCVSIYIPTHRVADMDEDVITLKNLLGEAAKRLRDVGMRDRDSVRLLEPAHQLLDDRVGFWHHQSDGLALFASPGLFKTYRLPVSFDALVVTAHRFHIKPLLGVLNAHRLFYVLALSQASVRLFRCSPEGCRLARLENTPSNMAEALRHDDRERQLQFHTRTGDHSGKRAAMFHGQGAGKDDAKTDISRFIRQVAKGVGDALKEEQSPLLLATVDYVQPLYREVNTYPHLLGQGIPGNPDRLDETDLAALAWPIVESALEQDRAKEVQRYQEISHTGLASADLREVLIASYEGRVDKLFLASGVQRWGRLDFEKREVHYLDGPLPDGQDLLELAAVSAWTKGGEVHLLDPERMPAGVPAAAIFRY